MPSPQTRPPAEYQRNAFAPAILAAIACLVGIALIGGDAYAVIRFAVTILAAIIGWFALQARKWWWTVAMLAVAVLWNPLFPFAFEGQVWAGAHVVAATAFLAAGVMIKSEVQESGGPGK